MHNHSDCVWGFLNRSDLLFVVRLNTPSLDTRSSEASAVVLLSYCSRYTFSLDDVLVLSQPPNQTTFYYMTTHHSLVLVPTMRERFCSTLANSRKDFKDESEKKTSHILTDLQSLSPISLINAV